MASDMSGLSVDIRGVTAIAKRGMMAARHARGERSIGVAAGRR